MLTNAKFVLINVESRESNGKMYYQANVEFVEDGEVAQVGFDEAVAPDLTQKYKTYDGFFKIGEYFAPNKGKQLYRKIVGVQLVK